ncbi:MAG TPA: metallophosphoesterase [Ktedonobacterales bacterium]
MTKVVITSDLHLGITLRYQIDEMIAAIAQEQPDLTVLAGDIGEGIDHIRTCLRLFRDVPGQKAALGGNHDVWALAGAHSAEVWERDLPLAVREAGMLWLEEDVWRADGLAVTGSIAWYDYSGADPSIPPQSAEYWMETKRQMHPDARFLDWPWSDIEFAGRCADGLAARVAALDADASVSDLLLVTHVPLFREQLVTRPEIPRWGYGNAFFGNLTLGERVRQSPKLRAVVSGHTHIGVRSTLAGERTTPVWVNPSDFFKPRYVVYEHPTGALRDQAQTGA